MLSLFAVLPCQAQSKKKIIEQQPDTIPFFRGMAVGVDLIGPLQLMVSDYGQYEASLRINLKDKYYPVFELGYGKADASDEATLSLIHIWFYRPFMERHRRTCREERASKGYHIPLS